MSLKFRELKIGDSYSEQICKNLSRTQIVQYAGASGDFNPIDLKLRVLAPLSYILSSSVIGVLIYLSK